MTSLRDGMNLVSYEFVACQASKKGVLILSEVLESDKESNLFMAFPEVLNFKSNDVSA